MGKSIREQPFFIRHLHATKVISTSPLACHLQAFFLYTYKTQKLKILPIINGSVLIYRLQIPPYQLIKHSKG